MFHVNTPSICFKNISQLTFHQSPFAVLELDNSESVSRQPSPRKNSPIKPDKIVPERIIPDKIVPDKIVPDKIVPDKIVPNYYQ